MQFWKTFAHSLVFLAICVGFVTKFFEPNSIVTLGSTILPPWVSWVGWSLASLASVSFIVLDWIAFCIQQKRPEV